MIKTLIALSICALTLTACGGSGGGSGRSAAPLAMQNPEPPPKPPEPPEPSTFSSFNFQQGTPSSNANAQERLKFLRSNGHLSRLQQRQGVPGGAPGGIIGCVPDATGASFCPPEFSLPADDLPYVTEETKADQAWKMGWTGKNVKLVVVDDFREGQGQSIISHGYRTRAVALQIAPESNMNWVQLNLGPGSNSDPQLRDAYNTHAQSGAAIFNHSFGFNPFGDTPPNFAANVQQMKTRETFQKVFRAAARTDSYHPNMLFVWAAGNHGDACQKTFSTRALDRCNIRASALQDLRQSDTNAGDRVIFVGALADNNSNGSIDRMADYSLHAGALKNDFIVAHDDTWQAGDSTGTSFAAPRVTGAAALVRHKFPNLNGPQLKQVLLQTADDLGVKGVDETFGYGKLNVLGALSPIDGLTR